MTPTGTLTNEWYIGFVPCPSTGIWRLARGRFGHCMAFRPLFPGSKYRSPSAMWLLVEANVWGLDCRLMQNDEIERLMKLTSSKGHLLSLPARPRPHRTLPPLFTCASTIGALVGLPGFHLLPVQLYRGLLKAGARVVSANTVGAP